MNQVLDAFKLVDLSHIEKVDNLLEGHQVLIINYLKSFPKEKLQKEVVRHGGKIVLNCTEGTTLAIAAINDFRCEAMNKKYGISVLRTEWLIESIEKGKLIDYSPRYVIYASKWLQQRNITKFDKYGDSYIDNFQTV